MTPDDIDQILCYYRTGKSPSEIATLMGFPIASMSDIVETYSTNCSACLGPLETYAAQKMSGTVMAERCVKCGRER